MISGRTLALLSIAAAVVGAGLWLRESGQWRVLVEKVPALATLAGTPEPAPVDGAPADAALPAPLTVRTWTDEHGVVHFEQASSAPRDAAAHTPGQGGTLADYERELESREGISIEDIARAKAAREAAAAKEAAAREQETAGGSAMDLATRQARELMRNHEQSLDKIRAENNQ